MEKLDFLFNLMDRLSGPAKSMKKATGEVATELDKVNEKLKELDKQAAKTRLEKVTDPLQKQRIQLRLNREELRQQNDRLKTTSKGMQDMGGSTLLAAGALGVLAAAGAAIAFKGIEAGVAGAKFATDAMAFRESTLTALRVMTGTEQSAQRILNEALLFAKKTPFSTREVVGGFTQLLGAGFKEDEVTRVFAAIGDAAAASGFDQQVIDRMVLAFAQIKSKGRLMGQEMLQVNEALGRAGVGTSAIYDQMAKVLGKTRDEVMKLQETGGIDADTAIFSIIKALEQKSGGAVGNLMAEQSKTLKGLLTTLASVPEDMFMSFDTAQMPGFTALKGTLQNLVQMFDTTSVKGKELQDALGGLYNTVLSSLFGGFSGADGMARLETMVDRVVDYIKGITPVIGGILSGVSGFFEGVAKGFGPFMSMFYKVLGTTAGADGLANTLERLGYVAGMVLGGLAGLVSMVGLLVAPFVRFAAMVGAAIDAVNAWWDRMTGVADEARSWGDYIGAGLVDGLLNQLVPVGGAVAQLASAAAQQFREVMQINSPSRLFHQYGEFMGQGLVGGVESEEGNAREAVESLGAARPLGAGGSAARGGMAGPINFYLQLPPGGTSEEAVSFAQRVREVLAVELNPALQVAFAGVAAETGEG